ncbi:Uncharacterised protein [uncultured archaeon]|nr:Uncharacterised protein [uncultured archaeon]
MKDMERPRETIIKSFREGLIQKHPKAFNIFLILALISLVFAGAFLLSDIMSFKSNAAQKGPFSGLYQKMPKESQTMVKNWQEKGITLINQLKSILGIKEPAKVAGKDSINKNKARALQAKNRLVKAKETLTRTGNLSHQENSVVSSNSSRTPALVQPLMVTNAIMTGSEGSEGSSYSPSLNGEDISAKDIENNHLVVAVTSNISENQLNSNKSIPNEPVMNESRANKSSISELDLSESVVNESVSNDSFFNESVMSESIMNEPVMNELNTNKSSMSESDFNESVVNESVDDESLLNETVMNESSTNKSSINESVLNESVVNKSVDDESLLNETVMNESVANKSSISESALDESILNESQITQSNENQSKTSMNLSSNTSNSLPATDQESNSTRESSYPIVPRNTNLSFDNHFSGFVALPQSQTNFAASNSAEIHDSITQDGNGSAASVLPEFNNTNNEIHNQNETSNLKTNIDSTLVEKAKNESEGAMLNQRSNITSDALVSSPKEIPPNSVPDKTSNITPNQITKNLGPDSAPTGNTLLATNSTSQFQEQKQNQTYNRNDSKPLLDGSSIPLPLPDNKAEGLQNLAEKNKNTEKTRVSTSSASAKSQESKKGRLANKPNVRTLKIPTTRG